MPYGTIKVDTITFTDAGVDKSVTISGLVQNPTFTGNVTATGTISGLIVQAPTVTGTTANFASGVYTTQISGAIVKVPAGTAGAPSIQVGVGASVAPGLYGAGTDLLGISTGGAGRIFIDSTGRLGVGTSSPGAILHTVNTSAGAATIGAFIQNSSLTAGTEVRLGFAPNTNVVSDNRYSWIGAVNTGGSNDSSLTFATTPGGTPATERLRIDGSGQLIVAAKANGTTNGIIYNVPYTGGQANAVSQVLQVATGGAANALARINMSTVDLVLNNSSFISFATSPGGGGPPSGDLTAERMRISPAGNVGIGTSSPDELLEVSKAASGTLNGEVVLQRIRSNTSNYVFLDIKSRRHTAGSDWTGVGLRLQHQVDSTLMGFLEFNSTSTAYDVALGTSTVSPILFKISNTEAARFDSGGRLLVGTSTARTLNTVTAALEVEGTSFNGSSISIINNENTANGAFLNFGKSRGASVGSNTIVNSGDNIAHILFYGANGSGTNIAAGIDIQVDGTPGVNDMPGRIMFSTTADGASSPTERLRIDSSGNVGIGAASDGSRLLVYGTGAAVNTLNLVSPSNTNGAVLNFADTNQGSAIKTIPNGAGGTHSLGFFVASSFTERMRIDNSGNVGIGTSSPLTKLDVRSGVVTAGTLESTNGAEVLRGYYSGSGALTVLGTEYSSGGPLLGSCVKPSTSAQGAFLSSTGVAGATRGAYVISGNEHKWYIGAAQTVAENSSVTMSEAMRIDGSGRLLVGRNATEVGLGGSDLLQVAGAINVVSSTNIYSRLLPTSNGLEIIANAYPANIGLPQSIILKSGTSGGGGPLEIARFTSDGKLLVGTSVARTNIDYALGTTGSQLQIEQANATTNFSIVQNFDSATIAAPATFTLARSGATSIGSTTVVANGNRLGEINFSGSDGTDFTVAACIRGEVDGTPGANDMPGRIMFSTTADGASSPTERLRINSSGNVGIGTSSPRGQLSISNNVAGSTVDSTLHFGYSAADYYGFRIINTSNPSNTAAGLLRFQRGTVLNWTDALIINNNGSLLVGTSTLPVSSELLAVVSSQASPVAVFKTDYGAAAQPLYCWNSATTGDNKLIEFATETSATVRGLIDYNRGAGQVRYNVTSDRRLKSNIQDSESALDILNQIKVRSYAWSETGYNITHGFIAQELNEAVPDAVKIGDDGEEVVDTWAVDNTKLVPVLTKALQEAIAKIETLEARLAAAGIA
jgi:hypothetical protein